MKRAPQLRQIWFKAIAFALALSPVIGIAQVQRAAFTKQTLNLAPKGQTSATVKADAFCLDETLPGPKADSYYRRVLHGGENAFVFVGDNKMSLDKAIADGKIRIRGGTYQENRDAHSVVRSEDSLPVFFDNLTSETVRVVFEKPTAMAADDWMEKSTRTRLTPETWRAISGDLESPSTDGATPSWDGTTSAALLQSMTSQKVTVAQIRQCLELPSSRKDSSDILASLKTFEPVADLSLGTEPAWLVKDRATGDLVVFHLSESRPAGPKGPTDRKPLLKTGWEDYRLVYAEQRKKRLESLSRKSGMDFAVLGDDDAPLEVIGATRTFVLDDSNQGDLRKMLRERNGRPLIVVSHRREWNPKERSIDGLYNEMRTFLGTGAEIYVDDNPERAVANLNARPKVRSRSDIAVYEGGFLDTKENKIQEICATVNLTYTNEKSDAATRSTIIKASNLVIVAGHKNSDYRNFLMRLATSGQLKGKVVLLASCAAETDGAFVNELLALGKANVVVRFPGEIMAADAATLVRRLGEILREPPKQGQRLEHLIDEALDLMIQDAATEEEGRKLREMKKFLVQVS